MRYLRDLKKQDHGKVDTHWRHGELMKDAAIRIRVEPELRDEFTDACKQRHVPAAQVLREYMREFVRLHAKKTKAKTKLAAK